MQHRSELAQSTFLLGSDGALNADFGREKVGITATELCLSSGDAFAITKLLFTKLECQPDASAIELTDGFHGCWQGISFQLVSVLRQIKGAVRPRLTTAAF